MAVRNGRERGRFQFSLPEIRQPVGGSLSLPPEAFNSLFLRFTWEKDYAMLLCRMDLSILSS